MMGYRQNGEFGGDEDDDEADGEVVAAKQLIAGSNQDAA